MKTFWLTRDKENIPESCNIIVWAKKPEFIDGLWHHNYGQKDEDHCIMGDFHITSFEIGFGFIPEYGSCQEYKLEKV